MKQQYQSEQPKPFDYGFRSRMVLLLVVMLVPFSIFSVYEAYASHINTLNERRTENYRNAREVANNVDELVQGTADLLVAIARSETARRQTYPELKKWFSSISAQYPYYKNIIFVDTNGNIRAAAHTYTKPDGTIIANVRETIYFKRAIGSNNLAFGDYMRSILSRKPVIHMTFPVFEKNKRLGFVAIAFDLARLQKRLVTINMAHGSEISVFDQNATIIARTIDPERWIGRNFKNLSLFKQVNRGCLEFTGAGPDGVVRMMTFRHTQKAPWLVSVCFDEAILRGQAIDKLLKHLALILSLMLVALIGWLWIGRDVDGLYKASLRLSLADPTTSLGSYLKFNHDLAKDIARAKKQVEELSIIMLDMDKFKEFNEAYGYKAGNRALSSIAATVQNNLRETDSAYRYGGDEICLILSDTDELDAKEFAERLQSRIESLNLSIHEDRSVMISISIGIAAYPVNAKTADELIQCATEALFEAKKMDDQSIITYSETDRPRKVAKGEG